MSRVLRVITATLLPLLTLVLGWQIGVSMEQRNFREREERLEVLYTGQSGSGALMEDPEKNVKPAIMWGVWRLLQKNYISPEHLKTQDMLYGATSGLVAALGDPYTVFMTPTENEEFHESLQGKLEGIGAELTLREGDVVVVAPLKGSPAEEAGLQPEDIIFKVNRKEIQGQTLAKVVHQIRGPKGTTVELEILRGGESDLLKIAIVRDEIKAPSVESEIKKTATGSVGYIALNQFGDGSTDEVRDALKSFNAEDIQGIVFDMRYNGGGYLEGAVELSSYFLKEGKVVTVQRRTGEPVHHYVSGHVIVPDLPVAVLINEGSASASEIFTGALQDHKRATVVGKKSFGKGTVQEVFDLPGGSSIRITTAKWLTPGGRDLGSEGIEPDIAVDRTREDREQKRDPQLDAAIEWLLDGEDVTKGTTE